ncbi:hypothetical protein [Streptomyces sp. NPDC014995]|uniref:hypothetical protein n=1 Tax=Streptomyces sp. NPDC014995 TaxID=3364936 RepID=UPI003700BDAC
MRKSAQEKVALPFLRVMKVLAARYVARSESGRAARWVVAEGSMYCLSRYSS